MLIIAIRLHASNSLNFPFFFFLILVLIIWNTSKSRIKNSMFYTSSLLYPLQLHNGEISEPACVHKPKEFGCAHQKEATFAREGQEEGNRAFKTPGSSMCEI